MRIKMQTTTDLHSQGESLFTVSSLGTPHWCLVSTGQWSLVPCLLSHRHFSINLGLTKAQLSGAETRCPVADTEGGQILGGAEESFEGGIKVTMVSLDQAQRINKVCVNVVRFQKCFFKNIYESESFV